MKLRGCWKSVNQGPVRIMAKDLVRTRNYVTRFIEMKTHLNAVSLKMQVMNIPLPLGLKWNHFSAEDRQQIILWTFRIS